ncbi:hypothetical protein D9M68_765350 [compost metagenome]
MAEDDLLSAGPAFGNAEPGGVTRRGGLQAFLGLEVQGAVGAAEAHAGEVVGDDPQARHAMQVLVPSGRLVAIHAVEEQRQACVVLQRFLDLRSALERLAQGPLRRDAGMDHGDVALLVVVQQLLPAQPVEQFGAVRCVEDLA